MHYLNRNITETALSRLKSGNILALTGARQTGKTTLCGQILPERLNLPFTYITFDDPDERIRFQGAAVAILESIRTPLIILDEVQKIPALFDPLKLVVDRQERTAAGDGKKFVLTGSSQLLLMKSIKESLAGRIALLNLYPFSLSEVSGGGCVPVLSALWEKGRVDKDDTAHFHALTSDMTRAIVQLCDEHQQWGGYPPVWQRSESVDKMNWLKDYRKTYIERDISDVGQVANIETFVLTQKLLCSRTAQMLSLSEIARDIALSVNTVKRYINLLVMSFQCYLLQPYHENIGKRLIKNPKIYFPDPGLNRAILGEVSVHGGALYESWVFSELVKWKQLLPVEPELYFYRTGAGMEIDFLVVGEGKILPLEVKSSDKAGYADGRHLETFMKDHERNSPLGLLVYRGKEFTEIRKNIWAVPDWYLFGGKGN